MLLKDRLMKKVLLKGAKTRRLFFFFFFFSQNYRLNSFFYSNWKQFQVVEIAKFEFSVTVHCGLCGKSTKLWPLKQLKTRVHFARSMLCCVSTSTVFSFRFLRLYTMIVTLLAKTQLYELTIIAAYNGDMYNYYTCRPMVLKLLIIV